MSAIAFQLDESDILSEFFKIVCPYHLGPSLHSYLMWRTTLPSHVQTVNFGGTPLTY